MKFPTPLPNLELLQLVFDYDPLTGFIYRNGKKLTGNFTRTGYYKIRVSSQHSVYAHRLAWKLFYREDPIRKRICHINGNPRDNRIENLRAVKLYLLILTIRESFSSDPSHRSYRVMLRADATRLP